MQQAQSSLEKLPTNNIVVDIICDLNIENSHVKHRNTVTCRKAPLNGT